MIEIQVSHRGQYHLVQIIKRRLLYATIVPGGPGEITNACGAPRSAMKQEISVASLESV